MSCVVYDAMDASCVTLHKTRTAQDECVCERVCVCVCVCERVCMCFRGRCQSVDSWSGLVWSSCHTILVTGNSVHSSPAVCSETGAVWTRPMCRVQRKIWEQSPPRPTHTHTHTSPHTQTHTHACAISVCLNHSLSLSFPPLSLSLSRSLSLCPSFFLSLSLSLPLLSLSLSQLTVGVVWSCLLAADFLRS